MIPRPSTSGAPSAGSDGVAENALPSASIAQQYDVSGEPTPAATRGTYPRGPDRPSKRHGSPGGGSSGHARSSRIIARRDAAYSFVSNPRIGTSMRSGSPKKPSRSAAAS